ncbi:MAG TPA: acyl-CoA dehydrogenase family protein [Syntrophomonadaceae bacterium]|jgi:alkylation response protein AidB-like acyl-CoA dehydrogenase|nr:acyl-CoA dehydrogenase family protein [Syntrophomonadaceae bacterium]HRX22043.1 acyl-CoA dehydrogenase family protein [Syntrophomonadaceae bacterium]
MDFSLSIEQNKVILWAREIAAEIKKTALHPEFSAEQFEGKIIRLLAQNNLLCPTIPIEYGGLGLDRFTTALVIEEIAAGFPSAAAVVDATIHAAEPILLAGSRWQKEEYLPALTGVNAGTASFALTEAAGGSDLSLLQSSAVISDGGFVLNGRKDWVINADRAKFVAVIAAIESNQKKAALRVFIVPQAAKGFHLGVKRKTIGLDYAYIGETIFDNAYIEKNNVIKSDEAGSGYLLLTQTFDLGRAMVGATSVGIARAAYETALEYAENRIQFGTRIRNHQTIAFALADMATKIEMARLITWKACWLMDQGGDYSVISAMAKVAASTIAQEVTTGAADILGAKGCEKGSFIEQLVRDARILTTIEGTNHMQKLVISSQL